MSIYSCTFSAVKFGLIGLSFGLAGGAALASQGDFFDTYGIDQQCFECRTAKTPKNGCDATIFEGLGSINSKDSAVIYAPWGGGKTALYKSIVSKFEEGRLKVSNEQSVIRLKIGNLQADIDDVKSHIESLEEQIQKINDQRSVMSKKDFADKFSVELKDLRRKNVAKNEELFKLNSKMKALNEKDANLVRELDKIESRMFVSVDDTILRQVFPDYPAAKTNTLGHAIDSFLTSTGYAKKDADEQREIISKEWKENDMIDFVLSRMVADVVRDINRGKINVDNFNNLLSVAELRAFLAITVLYHDGDATTFGDFVNTLKAYKVLDNLKFQFPTEGYPSKDIDAMKDIIRSIRILPPMHTVKDKTSGFWSAVFSSSTSGGTVNKISDADLGLNFGKACTNDDECKKASYLYALLGEDNKPQVLLDRTDKLDSKKILLHYNDIVAKIGKEVVFIIDALDEVERLQLDADATGCNSPSFVKIVQSLYSLIELVAENKIKMYLFIPKCQNQSFMDLFPNFGRDFDENKFNFLNLEWRPIDLERYSNFVFQSCRSEEPETEGLPTIKDLPTTKEFVGGDECTTKLFENVKNPRRVNDLLSTLVTEVGIAGQYGDDSSCKETCCLTDTILKAVKNKKGTLAASHGKRSEG